MPPPYEPIIVASYIVTVHQGEWQNIRSTDDAPEKDGLYFLANEQRSRIDRQIEVAVRAIWALISKHAILKSIKEVPSSLLWW